MKKYRPHERTARILEWTLEKVRSVPYRPSTRWAFYRCVQELGLTKEDYKNFLKATSRARKSFWNGWNPTTLADETRTILMYGYGFDSFEDWLESFKDEKPNYEKFSEQEYIVMVWFEAEAMREQFKYYTAPYSVPMVPFKGDPSIDFKWRIAEFLKELCLKFGSSKPVRILYFGDYEPLRDSGSRGKGLRIPYDALRDIKPWFHALMSIEDVQHHDFELIRCGLNREHIEMWSLPENPERVGEYQWEALGDEKAEWLIRSSIEQYWSLETVKSIEKRERADTKRWKSMIEEMKKLSNV